MAGPSASTSTGVAVIGMSGTIFEPDAVSNVALTEGAGAKVSASVCVMFKKTSLLDPATDFATTRPRRVVAGNVNPMLSFDATDVATSTPSIDTAGPNAERTATPSSSCSRRHPPR